MLPLLARATRWLAALALSVPLATAALAQAPRPVPTHPDSLRAYLRRPGLPDTTRVKYLLGLSTYFMNSDLDSGRYYAERGLALARRSYFRWGQAHAWGNLGAVEYYVSDFVASQRAFETSLRLARHGYDPTLVGHAYLGLGNVAWELHNAEAMHSYYAQAQQAYASSHPRHVPGELLVVSNRANVYLSGHQPALARQMLRQMPPLLRLRPNAEMEAVYLDELAMAQRDQHQLDSARATWQRAARQARATHMADIEAEIVRHQAELAQQQHQPAVALAYAQEAARQARVLANPSLVASALRIQAQALAALHRPGAYDTLDRYATLRDTLFSKERLQAVVEAQARFDRAGQQARIAVLEKDRRIAALETERRTTRTRLLAAAAALVALLLLAAVVLGYRRRQRAREAALRHELAANLHDDVGNLLTQISLQSGLLRERQHSPEQLLRHLDRLAGTAHQAARQMNDVIWGLGEESQSLPQLLVRMRDHAHEMLAPTAIALDFEVDDTLTGTELPAEVRQTLYLIFKESLHNAVKHAQGATRVQVRLARTAGQVLLRVQDDGRGPAPAAPSRLGGHGLRNMHARAEALGGTLSAGPVAGGFAVQLALPG